MLTGNDTLSTAISTSLTRGTGSVFSGTIATPDTVDIYRVDMAVGENLSANVDVQSINSALSSYLRIFNSTGTEIANGFGGGDASARTAALVSGTYYVGVSDSSNYAYDPTVSDSGAGTGVTSGDYNLTLLLTPPVSDANSDIANATPVSFIRGVPAFPSGQIAFPRDADLFQLQLYKGDVVQVAVNALAIGSPLQSAVRLFDASGHDVQAAVVGTPTSDPTLTYQASAAGTYYVGISGSDNVNYDPHVPQSGVDSSVGSFYLQINVDQSTPVTQEAEPNNTIDDANSIAFGSSVAGSIGPSGDQDFYEVTLTSDGLLSATAQADSGSHLASRLSLYGTDRRLLLSAGSLSGGDATISQHLPAGTYWLAVGGTGLMGAAATGDYHLDTSFVASSAPFADLQVEPSAVAIAAADLNGDGIPDLVVADQLTGHVSVLLGVGDGTFQPATSVQVGSGPDAIAIGKFTSSGHMDIAVANQQSGDVSILLGNGDGTFQPAVSYSIGGQPTAIVAGDFDQNGTLDLAVADADSGGGAGSVVILSGVGDGTFVAGSPITVGVDPSAIVAGHFGGDAALDLAVANRNADSSNTSLGGGSVSILRGDGHGGFAAAADYAVGDQPTSIAVGDINGDGQLDLAVANAGGDDISLLFGNAGASFQPEQRLDLRAEGPVQNAGSFTSAVTLGDFNGDGRLDVALANSIDSRVLIAAGNGNGGFAAASSITVSGQPSALVAADFLGNHRLDFATANGFGSTVSVRLGLGDGTFQTLQGAAIGSGPNGIVATDFNADGQVDLATTSSTGGSALLGMGDGTFQPQSFFATGSLTAVAAADLNGDGRPDLVSANGSAGTISVQFGLGDGTFAAPVEYAAGDAPFAIAIGDLNGDGRPDIVTANFLSNTVSVLLNNGNGTFSEAGQFDVGQGPQSIAIGDFDGDGRMDIAVANHLSGDVSILLGNGNGTFQPAVSYAIGGQPTSIVAGDFDQNGTLDLAVADADSGGGAGSVVILSGAGNGTFVVGSPITVGVDPTWIVAGDFNGDGRLDLATANNAENTVSVLLASGGGNFSAPVSYTVGQTPSALVATDLNGDGRLDLATTNSGDRSVSVLLGRGDGTFVSPDQFSVSAPISTPTLADVTGDGVVDSITLDLAGNILVRPGRAAEPGAYDAARVVNQGQPARAFTIVAGPGGNRIAAVDLHDNFVSLYAVNAAGISSYVGHLATGLQPSRIAAADLNGDGLTDLVVTNAGDGTVTVFMATPGGGFTALPALTATAHPGELALVDLTGNGLKDILVSDAVAGTVAVIVQQSAGSFVAPVDYRASTGPASFSLDAAGNPALDSRDGVGDFTWGDFTGDGATDLVVANPGDNSVSLLVGDGRGGFLAPRQIFAGIRPAQIQAGHFFPDGHLDLAILDAGAHTITVLRNDGTGQFQTAGTYDAGNVPNGLTVGDFNRDGRVDLVVGNSFGDVMALSGRADGTFNPFTRVGQRVAIAVGSPSASGQQSWLVTDQANDRIQLEVDGTTPGFNQNRTNGIIAPGAAAMADLNGDGINDLVVTNSGGNDILVYLGLGNNQFAPPRAFYTGTDPVDVTVADVNGDGRPDVVVTNQGSNDVSIFLNDPTTLLRPGPRLNVGIAPVQTQIGDFLGNGQQQLLVTNSGSNNVSLLPALGGGFFNDVSPLLFSTGASPQAAVVGNFFGGSGLDLVTLNYLSNTLTVYRDFNANGRQDIGSGGIGPLSGVAGDFMQSGATDLVIGNNSDGAFAVFVGGPNGLLEADSFFDASVSHPTAIALAGSAEGHDLRLLVADEGDENVSVFSRDTVVPSTALLGDTFNATGGGPTFSFSLTGSLLFTSIFALVEQIGEASAASSATSTGENVGGAGRETLGWSTFAIDQVSSIVTGEIHWLTSTFQTAAKSVGLHQIPDDVLESAESLLQVAAPGLPWRAINMFFDGLLKNGDQPQHSALKTSALDQAFETMLSFRESPSAGNLVSGLLWANPRPTDGDFGAGVFSDELAASASADVAFWEGIGENGIGNVAWPLAAGVTEPAASRSFATPGDSAIDDPILSLIDLAVPIAARRVSRRPTEQAIGRATAELKDDRRSALHAPLSGAVAAMVLPAVASAVSGRDEPEAQVSLRSITVRSDRKPQGTRHARRHQG